MLKTFAVVTAAALALAAPAFAQSAGNGVNTPAEQGTVTGPSHRSDDINNGMGEGRAAAPDDTSAKTNAYKRGTSTNGNSNGNNMTGGNGP